jgi:hypothetical protein
MRAAADGSTEECFSLSEFLEFSRNKLFFEEFQRSEAGARSRLRPVTNS